MFRLSLLVLLAFSLPARAESLKDCVLTQALAWVQGEIPLEETRIAEWRGKLVERLKSGETLGPQNTDGSPEAVVALIEAFGQVTGGAARTELSALERKRLATLMGMSQSSALRTGLPEPIWESTLVQSYLTSNVRDPSVRAWIFEKLSGFKSPARRIEEHLVQAVAKQGITEAARQLGLVSSPTELQKLQSFRSEHAGAESALVASALYPLTAQFTSIPVFTPHLSALERQKVPDEWIRLVLEKGSDAALPEIVAQARERFGARAHVDAVYGVVSAQVRNVLAGYLGWVAYRLYSPATATEDERKQQQDATWDLEELRREVFRDYVRTFKNFNTRCPDPEKDLLWWRVSLERAKKTPPDVLWLKFGSGSLVPPPEKAVDPVENEKKWSELKSYCK